MASSSNSYTRPAGVHDLDPDRLARFDQISRSLFEVFGRYGYERVGVPTVEYRDLYAPERIGADLYHHLMLARLAESAEFPTRPAGSDVVGDPGEPTHDAVLRPDFTAPIARMLVDRILAGHAPQLPVRWSYGGQVFRNQRPAPLRGVEFHQVGVELIGSDSETADLEALWLACDCARALDIPDWVLHLGHATLFRQVIASLLGTAQGPALDAMAAGLVIAARVRLRAAADDVVWASYLEGALPDMRRRVEIRLPWEHRQEILAERFTELFDPSRVSCADWRQRLPRFHDDHLRRLWSEAHHVSAAVIDEVLAISALPTDPTAFFRALDTHVHDDNTARLVERFHWTCAQAAGRAPRIAVTPAASRGLAYYTGVAFEVHTAATGAGTTDVCGGGRYAGLHRWVHARARQSLALRTGFALPADGVEGALTGVGLAFGIERLEAALRARLATTEHERTGVLVRAVEPGRALEGIRLAAKLRDRGMIATCATSNFDVPEMAQWLVELDAQGARVTEIVHGRERRLALEQTALEQTALEQTALEQTALEQLVEFLVRGDK